MPAAVLTTSRARSGAARKTFLDGASTTPSVVTSRFGAEAAGRKAGGSFCGDSVASRGTTVTFVSVAGVPCDVLTTSNFFWTCGASSAS